MYKRLKEIRASQGLNQSDFAKCLGIGQSTLAMMEVGKRDILDRHIKTICSVFNVNEEWLRTGNGDMFVVNDDTLLEKLANEYNMTAAQKRIVATFLKMDEKKRETILHAFLNFLDALQLNTSAPKPMPLESLTDDDIELKRRQAIIAEEFEAEKKGKTSLASIGSNGQGKIV